MSPEALAAIIGVFMPLVISALKRDRWPTVVNLGIAGVVSLAVGAASVWVRGDLDVTEPGAILTSAAAAFTAATVVYKAWFEGQSWNQKLTSLP